MKDLKKIKNYTEFENELKERLIDYPELILKKENEVLGHSTQATMHEDEMDKIKIKLMGEIASETVTHLDKDTQPIIKKKFPNEPSRLGELNKRLLMFPEHRDAETKLDHNKKEMEKQKIQLKYLFNMFTATKYLCKLHTGGEKE